MTMKGKSIKPNITNIENPFNIYPSLNLLGFFIFFVNYEVNQNTN